MRVSDIDYRDYCPVEESEQYELERDEIMFAAMQPTKGTTMHPVEHAQAVEAAKCPDCGNTMENAIPHGSPGLRRCANCKNVFPILSAPGPSREAATAEQCREFVRDCLDAHDTCLSDDETEECIEFQAKKLLAMFAGGTGDDGEAVKTPCSDCNRDWGHSYCGTCKGKGYV